MSLILNRVGLVFVFSENQTGSKISTPAFYCDATCVLYATLRGCSIAEKVSIIVLKRGMCIDFFFFTCSKSGPTKTR